MNDRATNCSGKSEAFHSCVYSPTTYFSVEPFSYPPFIHNLQVSPLQKATHFGLSSQDGLHQLPGDLLFLLIRQRHVPLLEPELALSAEQKHELHLQRYHTEVRRLVKSLPVIYLCGRVGGGGWGACVCVCV